MFSRPPTRLNKDDVDIRRTIYFNLLKNNSFEDEFHITIRKDKKFVLKYIIIILDKLTLFYK
jgi:hypothetical protein